MSHGHVEPSQVMTRENAALPQRNDARPRRRMPLIVAAALVSTAVASVTITVDRVDPSDEISQPPENLVVLDVLADVTDGDSWTLGAFGGRTLRGSRFVYGYPPEDPNTPGPRAPLLVNPGTANRFVSSVSKPRPRDADMRFRNGGASTEGDCGPAPSPYAYATHFAVAWVSNPPETSGSPTLDGAILRTGRHCRVWRKPGGGAPAW